MSVDVGSATGHLDLDISGFLTGLQTAQTSAKATMSNVEQDMGKRITSVGNSLTSAGKTMTAAVTLPIVGAGASAIKVTSDFESSMSKTKSLMKASSQDIEGDMARISQKAKEMGASTKFSASEASDAFGYMALAGWDCEQMLSGIDGVLALAAAGELDLAAASDMVTDYLTAFGEEAGEAGRMADVMAKASATTNTSVQQLGDAFGNCAVNAASFGLDIEQTSAYLGILANAGLKGSEAGTALSAVFRDITAKMQDGAIAIGDTNVQVMDQEGNFRSLSDIVGDVNTALDGMGDAEKSAALSSTFTADSIKAMRLMCAEGKEGMDELTDSLYGASGSAQDMADELLNNLNGQLTIIKSSLEGVALKIGEALMPYVKKLAEFIQGLLDKLNAMSDEEVQQVIKIAAIVAAIGPLLIIIGKTVIGVGSLLTAVGKIQGTVSAAIAGFTAMKTNLVAIGEAANVARAGFPGLASQTSVLGAALGGLTAPVIAVIAAIAALVAIFVTLWNTNEEFRNNIMSIWNGIVESFNNFTQGIVDRLNALGFEFESITDVIMAAWTGFCNFFAPIFEAAFQAISVILDTVFGVITGILDVFIGLFTGNWDQLWLGVQEIFGSIWDGIVGLFGGIITEIINAVSGFVGSIIEWFAQIPENVANFISNAWQAVVEWASNMVNSAVEMGSNFLEAVITFFQDLPYNVGYFIGMVLGNIILWATQMWEKAVEMGTNFLNAVVSFFTQLPGRILQFITSALQNVQQWVTNMVTNARTMGTNFINAVVSFFTQLPGKVASFLSQAIAKVQSWVSDMARKGGEAIQGLINAVVSGAAAIPGKIMEIGKSIVEGVWNGIQNAVGWFTSQVQGFFSGIVDGVKGALGINSPSKVFAREVGRWMPAGVAVGFQAAMPEAVAMMQESLEDGADEIEAPDVDVDPDVEVSGFIDKLKAMYENVALWFESIEERIGGSIDRMSDSLAYLMYQGRLVMAADGGFVDDIGYQGNQNRRASDRTRRGSDDGRGGGNSYGPFIFNCDKPIDEIEAARQFKKVERDISEGF